MDTSGYFFDDFHVGQKFRSELSDPVTMGAIVRYLELSGDLYPIHSDPDFAKARGLADMIVPGNFVTALTGGLTWRMGHLTNLFLQAAKGVVYKKPLFPGERMRIVDEVTVVEDRLAKPYGKVCIERRVLAEDERLIQLVDQDYRILKRSG